MAPQSTFKQQCTADLGFIELEDAPMDKARNIPEENVESRVASLTPKTELRCSTRQMKTSERYSTALHYLLLTDNGEPECYGKVL